MAWYNLGQDLAEKQIRAFNSIIKLSGRSLVRAEYLDAIVKLVRGFSGCRCVGLRFLNEAGEIPYEAYYGFGRDLLESEACLSLHHDRGTCVSVMKGCAEPRKGCSLTRFGSFYTNNGKAFMGGLLEEDKSLYKGTCIEHGLSSIAVIPLRYKNQNIGIIHLADERENRITPELVTFIEFLSPLIAEETGKFELLDDIRKNYDIQRRINEMIQFSFEDLTLEELLVKAIDTVVSIPWMPLEPKAAVFLVEDGTDILCMKAQQGLPKKLQRKMSRVTFDSFFTDKSIVSRNAYFIDYVDGRDGHQDMDLTSHYNLPLLFANRMIGILRLYVRQGSLRNRHNEELLLLLASSLAMIINRKTTELELFKSNALLEKIFANTHFCIAYLDKSFNFIRVNEAYAKSDNRRPEFFVGKNHFDLYPNKENEAIFNNVLKTLQPYTAYAKPFIYEHNPERGITYWDWTLMPIKDTAGDVEGLVFCLVDVTSQKRATEELLDSQRKLSESQRLSDIGTLAATVAHELRNPLGVIRTAIFNIRKKSDNPALQGHLNNIDKKILESDRIINNLLLYSRIKSPHYQRVNLYHILDECISNAKAKYKDTGIDVIKKYRGLKNRIIEADELQLKEVFANILDNAYDAIREVEQGRIEISTVLDKEAGQMKIAFQDNGSGIDAEDIKKLFEPFFTTKARGTGLGLTVSRQIINLHGGVIDVTSTKGKGSIFTVAIPVKKK